MKPNRMRNLSAAFYYAEIDAGRHGDVMGSPFNYIRRYGALSRDAVFRLFRHSAREKSCCTHAEGSENQEGFAEHEFVPANVLTNCRLPKYRRIRSQGIFFRPGSHARTST